MHYSYRTSGTCAAQIDFDIDENKAITNIEFFGGCDGNHKGIVAAVNGKTADEIYDIFHGITCGYRPTSCPDQLANAVMEAAEQL